MIVWKKVKMALQQSQYSPNFYEPIISNTIENLASPKVNQIDEVGAVTSQKITQ